MDFHAARQNMVESQVRVNDVTDTPLQLAMRHVARERLCAPSQAFCAYGDVEPQIAPGRVLMAPRDVSKLLQTVEPKSGEKALCIAAPYAGAVLASVGLNVTVQEGDPRTMAVIEPYLKELKVATAVADLKAPVGAAYDVIVVEGAVAEMPAAWLKALKPGGRLGVVLRDGPVGRARLYIRLETGFSEREVFDSSPSMLPGFARTPSFEF
ncbi:MULTISPECIES: protein-L-isoaspartate O-methyltransferase [Asticcacaulis]|uniref:protein-L-isoaspartate O-methyltransferase family protein n=1 Tax=Asticcacaulis TaxID=76890 RepID=UPI001AE0ED07|nr:MULTISPECIES: protein-L-isoaspartate O-methyltransferase [Asticcacaulis]MBP2158504.1 protein-L-isoaspartate(D-aspartate) O-methyltransferase [Asticcacaulis solisilvae]MDR6799550.1 protein-L-isoaspartate(D-aspartate) O-methyltransferase [Asticcacaulis sp. BE141]